MTEHWLLRLDPAVGTNRDPERVDEEMDEMAGEINMLRAERDSLKKALVDCKHFFNEIIDLDPSGAKDTAREALRNIENSLSRKK